MSARAGRVLVVLLFLVVLGCSGHEKVYVLKDECGPIYGNVYHSIKDDSTCRIQCRGTCESLEREFVISTFVDRGIQCHLCNCTCRE